MRALPSHLRTLASWVGVLLVAGCAAMPATGPGGDDKAFGPGASGGCEQYNGSCRQRCDAHSDCRQPGQECFDVEGDGRTLLCLPIEHYLCAYWGVERESACNTEASSDEPCGNEHIVISPANDEGVPGVHCGQSIEAYKCATMTCAPQSQSLTTKALRR